MKRRTLLATGAGVALGSVAGCAGESAENGATPTPSPDSQLEIHQVDPPALVEYEETFEVSITLENTGESSATEPVEIEFAGETVDTEDVRVSAGSTERLVTTVDAAGYDSGHHSLRVATASDTDEVQLMIEQAEAASFVVEEIQSPSRVDHDESFSVEALVSNDGDRPGEGNVDLTIDDEAYGEQTVDIDGGMAEVVTFDIEAVDLFSGQYELAIETPDDTQEVRLGVSHPNPYDKETLTVGLEQEVPADEETHDIVEEALEYWEDNVDTYAGYAIEYDYQPNADEVDVLITVVEEIVTCGTHTGEIMGCAPLVEDRAPETAQIRIVSGYRRKWMQETLKHELGHTLGLDHDDEPAHIMSNDSEDRIPNYTDRTAAIDAYNEGISSWNDGITAWDEAIRHLEDEDDSEAAEWAEESFMSFAEASSKFEDTQDVCAELDEPDAADFAEEARLKAESMMEAARSVRDAAQAFQRGAYRTGNSHLDTADEYLEQAEEYEIAPTAELRGELGFPVRE